MKLHHLPKELASLKEDKKPLVTRWVARPYVSEKFQNNRIPKKFFARHFGVRVVDHLIRVISGDVPPGQCPVITVMLMFFKQKQISLADIFVICSGLRQELVESLCGPECFRTELYREISLLIDRNFEGVIGEYFQLQARASAAEPQTPPVASADPGGYTTAETFWEENEILQDDIDELSELSEDVEVTIHRQEDLSEAEYREIIGYLHRYVRIVNEYYEFKELGYSLSVLTDLLEHTPFEEIDDRKKFQLFIASIMQDLREWCGHVFIQKDVDNIHYLDDSLLSSIAMLEAFLTDRETEEEELELF